MKQQRRGKIVTVSSGTVFFGATQMAHYVTSKAGVIGLTRSLARELGGALVFLRSGESDFITGQTLVVDGGARMHWRSRGYFAVRLSRSRLALPSRP